MTNDNRERLLFLVDACGKDKGKMADLLALLFEASRGLVEIEARAGVQTGPDHAHAILAAIDELLKRVQAC
jgi:hypothetical protein